MATPPVVFEGVWKKFRRGERHDSLRDGIPAFLRGRFQKPAAPGRLDVDEFWAVRDVSFHVEPGAALGIIGMNGAGKSTTLKLLTKILRPTQGACGVTGRIGALIEVAAGFHPDLTGRENVYLQAAIMGMKRDEVVRLFDDIVSFAGIGAFIDTPIKRYSSGMNARLGFAIAAHLEPDVLVIDEVLSVGDAIFQGRCLERIRALKAAGVALVFVSHNLPAVESLCDRALWLHDGTARFLGQPREAVRLYLAAAASASSDGGASGTMTRESTGTVTIESAELVDAELNPVSVVVTGAPVSLRYRIRCNSGPRKAIVGFCICRLDKHATFGENNTVDTAPLELSSGDRVAVTVKVHSLSLPEGRYYFRLAVVCPLTSATLDDVDNVLAFDVVAPQQMNRIGSVRFQTSWHVSRPALDRAACALV